MGVIWMGEPALAQRFGPRLAADPSRVITRLFVPGEELPDSTSRGYTVIDRVLSLGDDEVAASLADIDDRFGDRHRNFHATLREHFLVAAHGRHDLGRLTETQRLLIGAYFTMEYAVESAAFFNPSMVIHPDQSGLAPDHVRFVMSARSVGEGHLSSVEFRTGVIGPGPMLCIDPPGTVLIAGTGRSGTYHLDAVRGQLADLGADPDAVQQMLRGLPAQFGDDQLRRALAEQHPHLHGRHAGQLLTEQINQVVAGEYEMTFPADTAIGERLLWPYSAAERNGIEDVRLVRFVDDAGAITYRGTYTAYDGSHIAPKLMTTNDFSTFAIGGLAGPAARNKGMALFPRLVGGRHLALSRWDRENVSLSTSTDGHSWERAGTVYAPRDGWELVQVGNCGSPIETDAGWLVITHGVGAMRTYSIGAFLLDLDDPRQCVAALRGPLLSAEPDERDGYVPNVVYSGGALRHGDSLTIPYGISDTAIGFAHVSLGALLERMRPVTPPTPA
jgi:predicted GH43/DUF377 family glycosyl hydrolase